jgi:phage terminase large subunit-like protein
LSPTLRALLIHGEIGSGKTRRAAAWVEAEALAGRTVAGVLALGVALSGPVRGAIRR